MDRPMNDRHRDYRDRDEYENRDDRRRDDRDRPRRRESAVPCPRCGSREQRGAAWPWYLGTLGAMMARPVICEDCDLEFDYKKPEADWKSRRVKLALLINGIGGLGILSVVGLLVVWLYYTMGR
jgi:hypothetical protein